MVPGDQQASTDRDSGSCDHEQIVPVKVHRYRSRIIVSLIVIMMIMNSVAIVKSFVNTEWSPLEIYPVQTVTNERNADGVPVAKDGYVDTLGVKCSKEGEGPVEVAGQLYWQTVKPKGTHILTGGGTNTRYPCSSPEENWKFEFHNPVPPTVLTYNQVQFLKTGEYPLWSIAGVETPSDADREGVPRTWRTEPFYIQPQN